MLALPSESSNVADDMAGNGGDTESFPMICERCSHINMINPNNPSYVCEKCNRDVWG